MGLRVVIALLALLSCSVHAVQGSRVLFNTAEDNAPGAGCKSCANWNSDVSFICDSSGKMVGGSVCEAVICNGADISDIGFCGDNSKAGTPCSCDLSDWNPVCNAQGQILAWNSDCAKCISSMLDMMYSENFCASAKTDEGEGQEEEHEAEEDEDEAEAVAEEGEGEAVAEEGEGEAVAEEGEGEAVAEEGEGEAVAEEGEGEAVAEEGEGEAVAEEGDGEAVAEEGEGEAVAEEGEGNEENAYLSDCICPEYVQWVCFPNGSYAATNACFAACDLTLADADISEANCQSTMPVIVEVPAVPVVEQPPPQECSCPPIVLPVCHPDGSYAASNACHASCKPELADMDTSENYCPGNKPTLVGITEPYSPEAGAGCLCPMSYIPYCNETGHELASNSCDAECKGYNITEGEEGALSNENCYQDRRRKLQSLYCDVPCDNKNPEPLCNIMGLQVSRSACVVWCQGLFTDMNKYSTLYCDMGSAAKDVSTAVSSSGSSTKSSDSAAASKYGQEQPDTADSEEEEEGGSAAKFCICPMIFSPVCNSAGELLGSNDCDAECQGHDPSTFSPEGCPESLLISMNALPPKKDLPPIPSKSWTDEPCDCADEDESPVCAVNGTVVAKNVCEAECSGLKYGVDVSYAFCPVPESLPRFGGCDCNPDEYDPQCLEDGTWVSPSMCYALCYNKTAQGPLVPCPAKA